MNLIKWIPSNLVPFKMNDNTSQKRIKVAQIGPPHGVRGQVKLRLYIEDPWILKDHPNLFLAATGPGTVRVTLQKAIDKGWLATINNITDRTAVEKWRGTDLYLDRAALPDTDDDDGYYVTDLVGLRVQSDSGVALGVITAVDNFGASDLLNIHPPMGPDYYLPFTDDTIHTVEEGFMIIQKYEAYANLHVSGAGDDTDPEGAEPKETP